MLKRLSPYHIPLVLAGLAAIAWHNWRLWQRDAQLATRLRTERTAIPTPSRMPKVSVLVAAWNEAAQIPAHIGSFQSLRYPTIELMLCAGGTDGTFGLAQRLAGEGITVLEQQPGEGKQAALARCLAHADGELIYLTDADCLFDDAALVRLLAPLIDEGEHAATGGSRPLDRQRAKLLPSYLWAADVAAAAQMPQYSRGLLGRNAALTRHALKQIGGLDFAARTGTDYQLAQRLLHAGIVIRYVGASIVPTAYPETLAVYRRKQSRWLRTLLLHGWRNRAIGDVRDTLRTVTTGCLMLFAPGMVPVFGASVLVLWVLLVAHAASAKLRYALFAERLHGQPISARLVAAIVPLTLIDFAIWSLPLLDLLDARRRNQW